MKRFNFTDPFVDLPKLERKIIELRSFEAMLALFYAEELRKSIIDMVTLCEELRAKCESGREPRIAKTDKGVLKKALRIMVEDEAIDEKEHAEIRDLINFRNDLGHRVDQLFYDLEQRRFSATDFDYDERKLMKIADFDHSAFQRFELAQKVIDRACRTHFKIGTFRRGGFLYFSSTEKVLRKNIGSIRALLPRLISRRNDRIAQFNIDLRRGYEILEKHGFAQFNLRFPRGTMTKRGVEICYRLFDANIDELVVAQIFEMKLPSIRQRKANWRRLGGRARKPVDFNELPETSVPSKYDE